MSFSSITELTLATTDTPSSSRNDPSVCLVYSDSTRRNGHAHIGETSQRVANSGIRALWSWIFWPKNDTFLYISKTEKSEIIRFLNLISGAQTSRKPQFWLLSCIQLVKYLSLKFKFLAQPGRTRLKSKILAFVWALKSCSIATQWRENRHSRKKCHLLVKICEFKVP